MSDLVISGQVAERLQRIAQQEHRPVEALIEGLLDNYTLLASVPADVEDKADYLAAMKQVRPKIYTIAREYWQRSGNKERLALTDRELDEQFWLIDHEGIPRLKSEQGTIEIPPDPLDAIVGLFADSDLTDVSSTVRETMAEHYRRKSQADHDRID